MTSACRCAIRYSGAHARRDNVDRYVQARDDDETRIGLGMPQAWARYASVEAARTGAAELLREERVLRVMVVRNEVPGAFVEWVEK